MKKIVVNGTFDILHRGHIEMLEYARSLGDHLLVCIDTDTRVKQLKGNDRPINNQTDRAFMLAALKCVDAVWYFADEAELEYILLSCPKDLSILALATANSSGLPPPLFNLEKFKAVCL